MVNFYSRAKL